MYKYSIEVFYKDRGWITETRFYNTIKTNQDFDTKPIEGLRRNFQRL